MEVFLRSILVHSYLSPFRLMNEALPRRPCENLSPRVNVCRFRRLREGTKRRPAQYDIHMRQALHIWSLKLIATRITHKQRVLKIFFYLHRVF